MSIPLLNAAALSSKFPSLPLNNNKPLVGIYFAASWCPDCTPVTIPLIHAIHSETKQHWNVAYVSSDRSEEQLTNSLGDTAAAFDIVPFANEEERTELKRHFGACAGSEAGPLKIQRQFGIPTLIVLETATGNVLTTSGVEEIRSMGSKAVDAWMSKV